MRYREIHSTSNQDFICLQARPMGESGSPAHLSFALGLLLLLRVIASFFALSESPVSLWIQYSPPNHQTSRTLL